MAPKRVPQGSHFGSQNESKIVPKTGTKTKTKKRLSWEPLGWILGRFGSHLGAKKHQNLLAGLVFGEKRRFGRQDASKSDFGTTWAPKTSQKGTPKRAKNDPKVSHTATTAREFKKRPSHSYHSQIGICCLSFEGLILSFSRHKKCFVMHHQIL